MSASNSLSEYMERVIAGNGFGSFSFLPEGNPQGNFRVALFAPLSQDASGKRLRENQNDRNVQLEARVEEASDSLVKRAEESNEDEALMKDLNGLIGRIDGLFLAPVAQPMAAAPERLQEAGGEMKFVWDSSDKKERTLEVDFGRYKLPLSFGFQGFSSDSGAWYFDVGGKQRYLDHLSQGAVSCFNNISVLPSSPEGLPAGRYDVEIKWNSERLNRIERVISTQWILRRVGDVTPLAKIEKFSRTF